MNLRKKKNESDEDFIEDSDSDTSDAIEINTTARKKKLLSSSNAKRGRGRPSKRRVSKRQRISSDHSDRDTSPQPGPSGLQNNNCHSSADSDSNKDSEIECKSVDSDYQPQKDVTKRRKSSKTVDKGHNKSVNGVSSSKNKRNCSQVKTSKKKQSTPVPVKPRDVEELAEKLVYFLFIEDQKKYAIRKKAIATHVFKNTNYSSKLYNAVVVKANSILKKIYGMELMEIENQNDSYMIVNNLHKDLGLQDYVEVSKLKQMQRGFILYLLTVIFMNDNAITEDELAKCLKPLGVDLKSKNLHPLFGDVKKYISTELVKQMYLSYELISKDPAKYEIKWGVRAKQEFDKKEILQFACQIMGNTPEEWRLQYKDAEDSASKQE